MTHQELLKDHHTLRLIATLAVCDTRTVQNMLKGRPVLSTTRIRVEGAMTRLKLLDEQKQARRGGALK